MILVAYGTRPEWIKLSVLVSMLKQKTDVCVLYTGQQEDIGNFGYDKRITIKSGDNRLNSIISSVLEANVFDGVSHVIVQGDTASAFAVALAAFNRGIPVIHIEAGLRTFDINNPYPEESYRQMISSIAKYHFCPTERDYANLYREKRNGSFFVVGNTVIDTLPVLASSYDDVVLVTIHRRENHARIVEWFTEIEKLATDYPNIEFILPLHPSPVVKQAASVLKNTKVVNPLGHTELLNLLARSKCVISDSGGIQEEASFYKKKVLVCRKITERPANNQILISEPKELKSNFEAVINDYMVNDWCPFGNGDSSKTIERILTKLGIV